MQQRWDDLDKLIWDSAPEFEGSTSYNSSLMSKLRNKRPTKVSSFAAGYSLIMAGLMLMFMYTSNMEFTLLEMKYKVETEILMIKNNYSVNKYFLGE
jgi:hypothetical protein